MKAFLTFTFFSLFFLHSAFGEKTYKVKKGDSLYRISRLNEVSIKQIKEANELKSNLIKPGQILIIPVDQKQIKKKNPNQTDTSKKEDQATTIPKHPNQAQAKNEKDQKTDQKNTNLDPIEQPLEKKATQPQKPQLKKPILKKQEVAQEKKQKKQKKIKVGFEALSKKQRKIVQQQVYLDRAGMGPGVIDGITGKFTKISKKYATTYRPNALKSEVTPIVEQRVPEIINDYINPNLPGRGERPDFKKATESKCLMMYKSKLEFLAERFHCSEKLLKKLNPKLKFDSLKGGEPLYAPNITLFKVESLIKSDGEAAKHRFLRKKRHATKVDVNYDINRLFIWRDEELLASFPVTTNFKKGPKKSYKIEFSVAAPTYLRKKTKLDLKAGPNSPVGVMWCKLGDGFGIHGTADGAGNGYNRSSGCIRLSNWDIAIFVLLVPKKTPVHFYHKGKLLVEASTEPELTKSH